MVEKSPKAINAKRVRVAGNSMRYLVGVDTGGTFTDFTLLDTHTQNLIFAKHPSTPNDPSEGFVAGLEGLLADVGSDPSEIAALSHGSTVAINALLQDRVDDIGMVTTAGFRDVLELGRQQRPHHYDLDAKKPRPLAPRQLRLEIRERIDASGGVAIPLNENDIEAAADILQKANVSAVAVCFLHAYRNPVHEKRCRAILRKLLPGVEICISSDVLRELREYERFSTTTLNAALLPIMRRYLGNLRRKVKKGGLQVKPRISTSLGGVTSFAAGEQRPVDTLFSGPSAGVVGASVIAQQSGVNNFITFDVGGTSTDVCLVREGVPLVSRERRVAGWPVISPSLDVHSIGTGGGSLLWIDEGGFLRIGPASAGANPGPACYGLGGTNPTVTDANLVAQRLSTEKPLGGHLILEPDTAKAVFQEQIAKPLGLTIDQALRGTYMVLGSNLVRGIRTVSVERGHDPRDFTLIAFGGAGPMQATQLAREIGIATVLVPEAPGVLCALGLTQAGIRAEFSQTRTLVMDEARGMVWRTVEGVFKELEKRATIWVRREGIDSSTVETSRIIEARYLGQGHQLPVAIGNEVTETKGLHKMVEDFHTLYRNQYGYHHEDSSIQSVHFRLQITAPGARPKPRPGRTGDRRPERALIGQRKAYIDEASGFVPCPIYWRPRLEPADRIVGPAIIEQMDSTTVLLPDQEAQVDQYRTLAIKC